MGSPLFSNFKNDGFGWACLKCAMEISTTATPTNRSRLMSEGEAESKTPTLSSTAIAKWADREKKILECPRCGTRERAESEI